MPSPFPGMDPYLELHWLDVHTKLVAYAADALNGRLPEDLVASTEERVAVQTDEDVERRLGPDVRVFEALTSDDEPESSTVVDASEEGGTATATVVATAPVRLVIQVEPITERYIRIIEAGTERLVTVIE